MADPLVDKFLDNLAIQNSTSARTVKYMMFDFQKFAQAHYGTTVSELIKRLKEGTFSDSPKEEQPYELLQSFAAFLSKERIENGRNTAHHVRLKLYWARNILESNFIPISKVLYKRLVRAPKDEEPALSPIPKATVRKLIMALDDIRLQTFCLFLASMGWRSTQSLSVELRHLEGLDLKTLKFTTNPSFINISGKDSKTKKSMRRQLTSELRGQIEVLLQHTYSPRVINSQVLENGKLVWKSNHVKPEPAPTDRLFMTAPTRKETKLRMLYMQTSQRVRETIDKLNFGLEENGKRRKITLHTMRRFCFTQCERVIGVEYAKFHIGRKAHEYSKRTAEEMAEDFAQLEPYLTFLDASGVEEKQKVLAKELEVTNQKLQDTNKRIDSIKDYVDSKIKTATSLEELKQELTVVGNMTTRGGANGPKVRKEAAPPICAECGKVKDKVFKDYRGRGLCIQCITNA